MSIDEAGNAERWPFDELTNDGGGQVNVIGVQSGGGNWRRFYYPSAASEIDTEVTPFFWHDRQPSDNQSTGEVTFGAQTVIPLPPQVRLSNSFLKREVLFLEAVSAATPLGSSGQSFFNW